MATTVSGSPYVVTIEDSGGFPWSDVIAGAAAVGTLLAVVVALWVAHQSASAAADAANLSLRRDCALRISAWLGLIMLAADTHAFLNDSPEAGEWNDGGAWDTDLAEVNRGFYHLRTDVRIVFGDDPGLLTAFDSAQRALVAARAGLDSWREAVAKYRSGSYVENAAAPPSTLSSEEREALTFSQDWRRLVGSQQTAVARARADLERELRTATRP